MVAPENRPPHSLCVSSAFQQTHRRAARTNCLPVTTDGLCWWPSDSLGAAGSQPGCRRHQQQQQHAELLLFEAASVQMFKPDCSAWLLVNVAPRRGLTTNIFFLSRPAELNKNRRKLFEPPIRSSFLEGGASGRLSRQFHADMASISGRW